MCGICGVVFVDPERRPDPGLLARMTRVLQSRGPDAESFVLEGGVGLGHRRLSVIDPDGGTQPMTDPSGRVTIVYNGEVYNHAECRPGLIERGHRFATQCDTETILHLYQEYGRDCVDHLRGMFALAIWDDAKKELLIARDRFGVKPLYYVHTDDGSLYFASEIKALLEAEAVRPDCRATS